LENCADSNPASEYVTENIRISAEGELGVNMNGSNINSGLRKNVESLYTKVSRLKWNSNTVHV